MWWRKPEVPLLGRLRQENHLNPGGRGCSEPRLHHCTPLGQQEQNSVSNKTKPSDLVRLIHYHENNMGKTHPHDSVTSHQVLPTTCGNCGSHSWHLGGNAAKPHWHGYLYGHPLVTSLTSHPFYLFAYPLQLTCVFLPTSLPFLYLLSSVFSLNPSKALIYCPFCS